MADNDNSYTHQDTFAFLNQGGSLKEKLIAVHRSVQEKLPFVARISVVLYDPSTNILKTYVHSSGEDNPLDHYQALLDNAPSLKEILARGRPRVINNMLNFDKHGKEHTKRLEQQGYAASYTLPLFNNGEFFGFIFFNAYETGVFTEDHLEELDLHGHLITLMAVNELNAIQTLIAAIKTTGHITHHRDPETGSHLDRMSRYSRLIATALAEKYNLDDEYIEHIFMFSPLHDVGKIVIPDNILLKPGKLNEEEMAVMKTHALKGEDIIDNLLQNFGLGNISYVGILRNIVVCHHETIDGVGYPFSKAGDEIPLEARIVAVADIFDALTSRRPYKEAWSNEDAFAELRQLAGKKLDPDCVEALLAHSKEIETIQKQFKESLFG